MQFYKSVNFIKNHQMIGNDNVSISVQTLKLFVGKFKPVTSTQMKTVVAALYLAQNNGAFRYTNIIGLLQLDVDRKLKTKMLRLYNLQTMKLAFQIQLYYDFAKNYKQKDDKFYFFQYQFGAIGLLFRNKQDADIFALKIKSQSPTIKQYQQLVKQRNQHNKKQQSSKGFLGMFKRKVLGKQSQIVESSKVFNVEKVMTTQIDKNGHILTNQSNIFQKDIIERMGVAQKDKSNPQILNLISDGILIHQLKKEAQTNESPQLLQIIKQAQKQQNQYLQDCRRSRMLDMPPPPPPLSLLSPSNARMTMGKHGNLLQQIRNNNLKLKKVVTNQKGGINIDHSAMDKEEIVDFATALRKKILARQKALNKYNDQDDDQ